MKLKDIDKYINREDWRVKENSNASFSYAGLQGYIAGADIANYTLDKIYTPEIAQAHKDCFIHLHDLSNGIIGYCAGWSLMDLIKEGFNCDIRFIYSRPAKHLPAILGQIENFLFTLSQEWAGAEAFSSVDTLLAPFVKKDNLTYKEVEQELQQHIFNLNNKYRIAFQTPFSNYSFDLKPPKDLQNEPAIIGGIEQEFTYGECQREMDMINKAFIEVLSQGDGLGKPFGFPIPTYNITKDFNWDSALAQKLFEMAGITGTPYFSNFINSELDPSDIRSMCPLTPDTKVLVKSNQKGIRICSIKDIVIGQKIKNTYYEVWTPTGWAKAKPIQIPKTKVYEIVFSNGAKVKMGENHLQPTKDFNTVKAKDLKIGMWIPFNKNAFGTDLGSKELGYIVGAFLGDGSYDENAIIYSLDINKKDDKTEERLTNYWNKLGHPVVVSESKKNVRFVRINNNASNIIKRFVKGDNALTKCLTNMAFNMSVDFKIGLIEGYRDTDGAKNNRRLYTSSNQLREDLCLILSSLGKKYLMNYVDIREGRLGKNPNYRVDYPNRNNYSDLYAEDDNYHYYTIKEINEVNYIGKHLYCFELETDDKLFMLANGLITHNCRLRLDLRELVRNSSGLFASGDKTGCYDKETEVLTKNGWKYFKDITMNDEFYTLNNSNNIEIHKPIQLFEYDYDGEMVYFNSKDFNLLVTPNHRMIIDDRNNNRKFVEARDFKLGKDKIPKKGNWDGKEESYFILPSINNSWIAGDKNSQRNYLKEQLNIKMDDWLKFLGIWLSEGCFDNENIAQSHGYRVFISQIKEETRKEIEILLKQLPFNYQKNDFGFNICNKQLWEYIRKFGKQDKRYIPLFIKQLSSRQLNILLEWLIKGDGCTRTTGQKNYWTCSKQLADDIQEIVMKTGNLATITLQKRKITHIKGREIKGTKPIYVLNILRSNHYHFKYKDNIKNCYYKGKVYCCEVPNNTLMVRRSGKVTWCGNSLGVVTLNTSRMGYLNKQNKFGFYSMYNYYLILAKESLLLKRKEVLKNMENGLLPYTKRYLGHLDNHFNTIGIIGVNECLLNMFGYGIETPEGKEFSLELLDYTLNRLQDFQEETGLLFNLEATPAEGVTHRFAKHDLEDFPDIITANGKGYEYYTNSTMLPVEFTENIWEAFNHQDELQKKYTSGTVFHIFLNEPVYNYRVIRSLVKKAFTNYKLPYITITPNIAVCPVHGRLTSTPTYCPHEHTQEEIEIIKSRGGEIVEFNTKD